MFCGANVGSRPEYTAAAEVLGVALARREVRLVYGGGQVGLMGVVANSVLAVGGEVVGVLPESLATKELAHPTLTEMRVVGSMHERKTLMADLADGFIALPGGYGTLDELCEILTWAQLGFHAKPVGLLNAGGFFDGFLAFLDHAAAEGFVRSAHRDMLLVDAEADRLLDRMATYEAPKVRKWIRRDET
ncbi:MAG: TIGR00730 family Rossman fold protein [Caldilineales bacterium]|nr:TIGR00730 family Rossman fold protein [Caldilineales bacterium]